jgi:hypothetical protein
VTKPSKNAGDAKKRSSDAGKNVIEANPGAIRTQSIGDMEATALNDTILVELTMKKTGSICFRVTQTAITNIAATEIRRERALSRTEKTIDIDLLDGVRKKNKLFGVGQVEVLLRGVPPIDANAHRM